MKLSIKDTSTCWIETTCDNDHYAVVVQSIDGVYYLHHHLSDNIREHDYLLQRIRNAALIDLDHWDELPKEYNSNLNGWHKVEFQSAYN